MSDEGGDSDGVGYGKPPKRTRFKSGQSGNPKGRPRKSESFVSLVAKALEDRVTVTENGRRRSITKREALAKQFANKGAAGDLKAAKLLLELLKQIEEQKRDDEAKQRDGGAGERILKRLDRGAERLHARVQFLIESLNAEKKQ
jgi:hypothetical protein